VFTFTRQSWNYRRSFCTCQEHGPIFLLPIPAHIYATICRKRACIKKKGSKIGPENTRAPEPPPALVRPPQTHSYRLNPRRGAALSPRGSTRETSERRLHPVQHVSALARRLPVEPRDSFLPNHDRGNPHEKPVISASQPNSTAHIRLHTRLSRRSPCPAALLCPYAHASQECAKKDGSICPRSATPAPLSFVRCRRLDSPENVRKQYLASVRCSNRDPIGRIYCLVAQDNIRLHDTSPAFPDAAFSEHTATTFEMGRDGRFFWSRGPFAPMP